jgi:hypothetical protein
MNPDMVSHGSWAGRMGRKADTYMVAFKFDQGTVQFVKQRPKQQAGAKLRIRP